jgi:predicted ArsR family transcriptional regulator
VTTYTPKGTPIFDNRGPPERPPARETKADAIYRALEHGGDLAAMAAQLGISESEIRKHIQRREKTGQWKFHATAWRDTHGNARSSRQVVAAGRLRRV